MRYVFTDIETTGLKMPKDGEKGPFDEIIQIGAIVTGDAPAFRELERIDVKVWPTDHGMDALRLFEATDFKTVYDEKVWTMEGASRQAGFKRFQKLLRRYATVPKISKTKGTKYKVAQLVGYNIDFDKDFLFGEFKKEKLFLPARGIALDVMSFIDWLDTLDGNKPMMSLKLEDVCKACDVPLLDAHNAMADIEATVELARRMAAPLFK